MTIQIPNIIVYKERRFMIAVSIGSGLFDPQENGIEPGWGDASCHAGYYCDYCLKEEQLYLTKLAIVGFSADYDKLLTKSREGPTYFFGREPKYSKKSGFIIYTGLFHPFKFTGGLLLVNETYPNYLHTHLHPACGYSEVHELIFDNGRLQSAVDHSAQMSEFSEMLMDWPLKASDPHTQEIKDWIHQTFSHIYQSLL
jgi:hypothetical protein